MPLLVFGWERYVGRTGHIIGMSAFGASAPLKELQKKFGFTPERIVAAAKLQLERHGEPSHPNGINENEPRYKRGG